MRNATTIGLLFLVNLLLTNCSTYNPLPEALADPENVTTLKIQNVRLDSLPKEIGTLTNLKTLYLFRNKQQKIPDEIGNLSNLVLLNAAYCGTLVRIPETIQYCHKLDVLYVDETLILPFSIRKVNSRLRVVRLGKGAVR
ncbi:MAG: hypothetical protein WC699_03290 [Bacteroidales bacterium]|jgi:Leucine-rich repeat (LRR) protein